MKRIGLFASLCIGLIGAIVIVSKRWSPPPSEEVSPQPEPVAIPERSPGQRAMDVKLFEIHKSWVGTAWAFSGTSQVAGEGSIACGYFVTTTLRHAGMDVDGVRLAQAASETMILEITDRDTVRRFSDASLSKVLSTIQEQGEGYYIVGLDDHTGFMKVEKDGGVVFIHSGPGKGVVVEAPEDSQKLSSSRYRVTGKIEWPVDSLDDLERSPGEHL